MITTRKVMPALAGTAVLLVATACGSAAAPSHSAAPAASGSAAATASQGKLTTVTYRLDWIPVGYEVPFIYGVQQGIYQQYGLNVKWAFGTGSADTTKEVATGKVMFGNGDANSVLKLNAAGEPVTMVFGYMQENPDAVIFPASSNIKTPADLTKVSIGASPGSSTLLLFPAFLKAVGLSPAAVHIDSMSASEKVLSLLTHKVGAFIDYAFEVQPELAQKGLATRTFLYAHYGVNPINLGIVVSDQTLKTDPKLVQAFVDATEASIKAAEAHPNAAVNALIAASNGTAPSKSILLEQWRSAEKLLQTPNDAGHPIGWMSPKDWSDTEKLSTQYLGLKTTLPLSTAYTNQFVDHLSSK